MARFVLPFRGGPMEYLVPVAVASLLVIWLAVRKYNAKQVEVEVVESVPVRSQPGDEVIMQSTAVVRNGHLMARCSKTGEFAHPDHLRSVAAHPPRGERRRASDGWT